MTPPHQRWNTLWAAAPALVASLALLLAACGASPSATATPTPAPTATHIAPTATPAAFAVKVYFSKHPDSEDHPAAVFPVDRMSPTPEVLDVATYAISQLIAGPAAAEQAQGYYTPLKPNGPSNCGGADFAISLDHRASTPEPGTATLQFCRVTGVGGELDDARVTAEVSQTLLQLAGIKQVVILTLYGDCFGDLSGRNMCLNGTKPTGYPVKVYFSKHPDSDDNPQAVFAVQRVSPTLGVATYAISQLLAGPTASEKTAGYYTPLSLTGISNCGGPDFVIKLDTKGSTPQPGTATLQFCRTTVVGGELDDPRAMTEMSQTLMQFSNITKVVVLEPDGTCFGDLSGQNTCLK